jgi:DNA polymerase-3 subunit gamma/tau
MAQHGVSFEQALQEFGSLWHRIAIEQIVPGAGLNDDAESRALKTLAQQFDADEVQLYYQIAGQGRQDLVFAPDEYAGFTMTLLRMLAFAPQSSANSAAASAPGGGQTQPAARQQSAAPSKIAAAGMDGAQWPSIVAALKISGMGRQLAQHCEWLGEFDGVFEMRLADAHKHLAEKGPQERLRAALEEHLGRPVRLRIRLGQPAGMTPAQLDDEQRRSQLASAARALNDDPFVRELVDNFGARVVPDSIKVNR